jgi:hypothetical protein
VLSGADADALDTATGTGTGTWLTTVLTGNMSTMS